jgi:hypothetical protein
MPTTRAGPRHAVRPPAEEHRCLGGVLDERARVLPTGSRVLVYGWAPDGARGPPLAQRQVGGTP